jgi:hypothetical protein
MYFIPQHCISYHNTVFHTTTLYFIPKYSISYHNTIFHTTTLYFIPQHCISYHNTRFHTTTLYFIPQHCISYHNIILHTTTLYFIPQHCISYHNIILHTTTQYFLNIDIDFTLPPTSFLRPSKNELVIATVTRLALRKRAIQVSAWLLNVMIESFPNNTFKHVATASFQTLIWQSIKNTLVQQTVRNSYI